MLYFFIIFCYNNYRKWKKKGIDVNMLSKEERLNIYKTIDVPIDFGYYFEDGEDSRELYDFATEVYNINQKAVVTHGISKAVIIDPDLDVVVKVPFNTTFYYNTDNGDDLTYDPDLPDIKEEIKDNFCQIEADIYQECVDEGYGYEIFLAKTKEVDNLHYIQEKCETYGDKYDTYNEDFQKKTAKDIEKYKNKLEGKRFFPSRFILDLIKAYGEDRTFNFLDFLDSDSDLARYISMDLYESNIGYRVSDGTPCIIDYSGWWED